jgi:hypothetical protein
MKQGRKKPEKDEDGSRRAEPEKAGSKKDGCDDSGTFKVDRQMVGGNPDGIDGIRALQIIAMGIASLVLVWFVLHNILNII